LEVFSREEIEVEDKGVEVVKDIRKDT